jgi:hypothetical protein
VAEQCDDSQHRWPTVGVVTWAREHVIFAVALVRVHWHLKQHHRARPTWSRASDSRLRCLQHDHSYRAPIQAEFVFYKMPGSYVIARYVKSSHLNDPGHTVLEILLALFAICTLHQSRTRADNREKHFIHIYEKVCPPSTHIVTLTHV